MVKKMIPLCLVFVTLLLSSACATQPKSEQKTYDQDGMLGITNANPNLQTSPTHHNYTHDMNLAEHTLRKIAPIQGSRVIINGGNMYVHIQVPTHFSKRKAQQLENNVLNSFAHQFPRYKIHLTLSTEG